MKQSIIILLILSGCSTATKTINLGEIKCKDSPNFTVCKSSYYLCMTTEYGSTCIDRFEDDK